MTGYRKGTTPEGQLERLEEAFALACAAIQASPDAAQAWAAVEALRAKILELQSETAAFRGWLAAYLQDQYKLTTAELAAFLGVSRPRASQIMKAARERGNPVTDPTSLPEPQNVVLAIVTSGSSVVVAERRDKVPPFTFPGGEINPGESLHDAASRRVLDETGLRVTKTELIGRRLHPRTARLMSYVWAQAEGDLKPGDPEDLADVRWMPIAETREKMPDMYEPVRQRLDALERASEQDGGPAPEGSGQD